MQRQRITTVQVRAMKRRGEKIAMLTAYDYPTAKLLDQVGIPLLLVGDSVGTAVLGYETTVPVTVEDMVHHARAVARGTDRALVVADMPFMSYRIDRATAMRTAARLVQEGGAHAIKLEGAGAAVETVAALVEGGIPVMGHLGLTPQSVHQLGGYRVQGRRQRDAERIVSEAKELEAAGAFAVVLELVQPDVASRVTESLAIPTIGIGSGPHCDGQVQVLYDLLGLAVGELPRHARRYADLAATIGDAARRYADDVARGRLLGEEPPIGEPDVSATVGAQA